MLCLALLPSIAAADVKWVKEHTGHFEVVFPEGSERNSEAVMGFLEPELARISAALDAAPPEKITVVLTPSLREFGRMQGTDLPDWISGTAYPGRNLIFVRPLLGGEVRQSSVKSVVSHEITHIVLHRKLGGVEPPRWLDEGLAVLMGEEPFFPRTERLLPVALYGKHIPFSALADEFPDGREASSLAYAQSGDFVGYLFKQYGRDAVLKMLASLAGGSSIDAALTGAFGKDLDELNAEWLQRVRRQYGLLALFSGGSLWFLISLLFIAAYLRKRARVRERKVAVGYDHGANLEANYWVPADHDYDYEVEDLDPEDDLDPEALDDEDDDDEDDDDDDGGWSRSVH